jgi:hypothetical protein
VEEKKKSIRMEAVVSQFAVGIRSGVYLEGHPELVNRVGRPTTVV